MELTINGRPTTVEITIGCALADLDLRMPYVEWRRQFEALSGWQTRFAERASMQKTAPST